MKLGRIRPKRITRTSTVTIVELQDGSTRTIPRLAAYYDHTQDQSPPPASIDYSAKALAAIAQMYGNDQWGDCVIAGKMHQAGIWSGNETGSPAVGTTSEAYSSYQSICGPGDNGCNITAVLDVMKSAGIPVGGVPHKIAGYVSVDWTNKTMVQVAIQVFGSLTFGINLPQAWMDAAPGGLWDVTNTAIIGGHDVCAVGYNPTGVVICTWGGLRTITWAALASRTWLEECYAELSPDWYSKGNLAPNGIDGATLAADLAALGGGVVPTPPGPVPPTPVPPIPPTPPPITETITLSQNVKAGQLVRFTNPKTAGVYTKTSGTGLAEAE